ncbi:3110082J24Rik [Phodopus roborovskii]|uniref:3110082J24Rik protein n=1 Tax=Phodopus roborovskii TaxID=109678 RepID=A0AAU9Z6L4_PHORO|nr:3110082J24Rik [Phodopus roborovskii]
MRSSGKAPMLQRSPASPAASFSMASELSRGRRPGAPTANPARLWLRARPRPGCGSHVAGLLPRGAGPRPRPIPAPRPARSARQPPGQQVPFTAKPINVIFETKAFVKYLF